MLCYKSVFSGKRLNQAFFNQPSLAVAKLLLGKYLVVKKGKGINVGQIIETEAYIGPLDKANHACRGKTPRTKVMFGSAGRLYVYLIYGMYYCLNIVTERPGFPAAVLIRSIKPILNISGKTDGPGKLCRELKISKIDNNLNITKKNSPIYIIDRGEKPKKIVRACRVGVDYAGIWAEKKWRFIAVF